MTDEVLVEVDADGVALVTLNRPERLNAVTLQMGAGYLRALRDLDADPAVRVIVVTGAGRGFCAGADLSFLGELSAGTATTDLPDGLSYDLPMRLGVPVLVAVNGPAAGLGTAMLLAADIRFVARSARISTTFSRLGLVAEYGTAWLLPRLVGQGAALELLLSGRTLDADECFALGLAQRVLPDEELLPAALAWARDVATGCAPRSLAQIKAQVHGSWGISRQEAFEVAEELMVASFATPEVAEGVGALLGKRAPVFPAYERGRA